MTQEREVMAVLVELFREILGDSAIDLRPDDKESDIPGFDSSKKVLLILAVEERFGIYTQSEEIDALRRVADWVALVLRHGANPARA